MRTIVLRDFRQSYGRIHATNLPEEKKSKTVSWVGTTATSIAPTTDVIVPWTGLRTGDSTESSLEPDITVENSNRRFRNTSLNTITLSVTGYVAWQSATTSTTKRDASVVKNGNIVSGMGRLSFASIVAGTTIPSVPLSATVVLNPNEYFEVWVYHNDSSSQNIHSPTLFPGSRLTITQLV